MASEKKGSKGRFLYLFDWHNKPRKKLFPSTSQTSGSIEGKENVAGSGVSQCSSRESRFGEDVYPSKGSGDGMYTPSINGDEGYGNKAPGVVARLMGLESLPTSGEASSVCSHDFESHDLGSSYYPRNVSAYHHDHHDHALDYSYVANRLEGYHLNSKDSRSNMVRGRSIERFQTEVLPPKSAKPISITHHKLLSPIKSPGFIPTNDTSYIIEAAARMIDPGPQATPFKRNPSFGSASSPLKLRDLREKMEAAHRSTVMSELSKKNKQFPAAKQLRGNARDRLPDIPVSRNRTSSSETSGLSNSARKGKSASPAVRLKENVQKKDGSASSSKSLVLKEHKQLKPKQSFNSQLTAKKSRQTYRSPRVPRQNTEKQNCISNKDKAISKSSVPSQQLRASVQIDGSASSSKTSNKVFVNSGNGSKKLVSTSVVTDKQLSSNRVKTISKNKELVNKEKQVEEASIADNLLTKRNESGLQRDFAIQTGVDNKKAMDVISFTFNSPIKKAGFISHSSNERTESSDLLDLDSYDTLDHSESQDSCSPLLRLKLIGSDHLSLLLDQTLKELTDKVEHTKSQSDTAMDSVDAYSVPNWSDSGFLTPFSVNNKAVKGNFLGPEDWRDYNPYDADKRKEIEGECSSINKFDTGQGRDPGHLDISAPGCSVSNGSCISSNSRSDYTYGYTENYLCQSEEEISCTSTGKSLLVEDERDISDTASSSYYEEWDENYTSRTYSESEWYQPNWELQYVRQIIRCAALKEPVLNADSNVIDSIVFDQTEDLINNLTRNTEDCTKLRRKLFFDYLNEFLSLKWEQVLLGSSKSWTRWRVLLQKEDWLVEELFKEISGLENMQNLMVDELVEKDMGTQYRGWLDFEMEMLEEGIDIERDIMDSLIDELVLDFSLI